MGRLFNLRAFCILVTLSAICVGLVGCTHIGESPTYELQLVVDNGEDAGNDSTPSPEVQEQADPASEVEQPNTEPTDGEASEPETQEPTIDPASLSAGDVVSSDDIASAGGADVFFWTEEISDATFARMEGKSFGSDCTVPRSDLRYVRVLHVDAEGTSKVGELVVHRNVADEIVSIFRQLYDAKYPIKKMHLVDDYNADDDASCVDDNTSAFNFRVIAGTTTISNHAYGLAIDINTFENPYCRPETGYVSPAAAEHYADRSLYEPYMIHTDDLCYELFIQHGWSWGGDWSSPKDYQHFEKPGALWQ